MNEDLEKLRDKLVTITEQAIDLRFGVNLVSYGADPVELNQSFISLQEVLTELESILSQAIRSKALLDRKTASARMVWQEAWDKALDKITKRPMFGEYTTGKEKASAANVEVFEEARALRKLEEHASFANEAVDIIRLHYYGLDKVRQDLRKRLDMSQTDYYS